MRRALVLSLVVLAAAAAAVLLLSRTESSAIPDAPTSPDAVPDDDLSVGDAAPGRAASERPRGARNALTIDGTVSDDGRPAVGAEVEATRTGDGEEPRRAGYTTVDAFREFAAPAAERPAWRGVTDEFGRFTATGLAPGRWRVVARSPDGRTTAAEFAAADTRRAAVHLDLPPAGYVLRGRIERPDGRPLPARVALMEEDPGAWKPESFARLPWVSTGADGSFVFGGIRLPRAGIVVAARGLVESSPAIGLPRDEPYVLRLGDGAEMRPGLVRDAATGEPIRGASVHWSTSVARDDRWLASSVTTGRDGRFEVPCREMSHGFVEAPGWSTERWAGRGAGEIVVELSRLTSFAGRVVAVGTGAPVAGATVWALDARDPPLDAAVRATTADDGSFRVEAAPTPAALVVLGGGWVTPGLHRMSADFPPAGADAAPIVLAAERAGRVEGRVLGPDGSALPGTLVQAWSNARVHWRLRTPVPSATTDAEGRFAIDTLVPGASGVVRADADGLALAVSGQINAMSGAVATVELRFVPSWTVDVQVLRDDDGTPVRGARVIGATRGAEGQARYFGDEVVTDREGSARVGPLPHGAFGLHVEAPGLVASDEPWWLDEAALGDPPRAVIRVPRGDVIAGRIEAPPEVAGCDVYLKFTDVATRRQFGIDATPPAFRIDGLPRGTFDVSASVSASGEGHWAASTQAVSGTTDLVLTLSPSDPGRGASQRRIRVRVRDPSGAPVPTADVAFAASWGGGGGRQPGSARLLGGIAELGIDGRAERVIVEVQRPRDEQDRPVPFGAVRMELPDPAATELDLRLPASRSIEGRVVDANGVGVAGARILAAFSVATGELPGAVAWTWSASDGRFRLTGLGEGRFRISYAAPPDRPSSAPPVEADAGARDVTLVVPVR